MTSPTESPRPVTLEDLPFWAHDVITYLRNNEAFTLEVFQKTVQQINTGVQMTEENTDDSITFPLRSLLDSYPLYFEQIKELLFPEAENTITTNKTESATTETAEEIKTALTSNEDKISILNKATTLKEIITLEREFNNKIRESLYKIAALLSDLALEDISLSYAISKPDSSFLLIQKDDGKYVRTLEEVKQEFPQFSEDVYASIEELIRRLNRIGGLFLVARQRLIQENVEEVDFF